MNTKKLFLALSLFSFAEAFGQDIHFSQYNFSPLTLNPALTSAYKNIQGTIHYKDQWRTVKAYRTAAATYEMKFSQFPWVKVEKMTATFKKKVVQGLAMGINVFNDNAAAGTIKQTQGNFSLAYHSRLSENNMLSGGMMAGFAQRVLSPDNLRWNNQYSGGVYDPSLPSGENFTDRSLVYGDYAAGLLWSYGDASGYMTANDQKHFNAGVSVAHLSSPKLSFEGNASEKLKWKWTAHANSLIGIKNTKYSIGPSFLFMQQGSQQEITFGGLIKYKFKDESQYTGYVKGAALSLGFYYRNKDAVIPYFLIEMDKYSIGVSYDTNISGLTSVTSGKGGIEIALRFSSPSSFLYQNKSRF